MASFFTELNRKPVPKGLFDFVTHSVCPIVHAADDISVMETLEALPSIIASTRHMVGKTPYHLGPSSIPCRDNPYGAAVAPNPGNGRVCLSDTDPRQRGLYAAAWNVGLLAALAKGGVEQATLGAATGPQGAIYRKARHKQPWFDSAKALVYPVYHVIAGMAPASGHKRLETDISQPAKIAALAHQAKGQRELWLANLTAEPQTVKVSGFDGAAVMHHLGDDNFKSIASDPGYLSSAGEKLRKVSAVELGPFGVVRIKTS
jgi:hypothetical protein